MQILPLIRKHKIVHLNKTDARLANNGLPLEIQKLRCRVNYSALRFTSQIEELGRKVVALLRKKGPFLVLHLRYEMDMLAFSGCTHGCTDAEVEELTRMRYWVLVPSTSPPLGPLPSLESDQSLPFLQICVPMVEGEGYRLCPEEERRPLPSHS